jgi:hypothetical protein
MDEDKLQELFDNFKPELSSDNLFMNKLQQNLNSVELVRQQNAVLRAQNKTAVAIAAFVGFVVGVLFTLALPYIGAAVANLQASLQVGSFARTLADNYLTLAWIVIGGTAVFSAVNT